MSQPTGGGGDVGEGSRHTVLRERFPIGAKGGAKYRVKVVDF